MTTEPAGRLWLQRPVLDLLLGEAARRSPLETGGLLLGYATGEDVVVTHATLPGLRATHEQRRYVPDAGHDEAEVARLYRETSRGIDYLGDWHTHPTAPPYLSRTDRRTLRRIARCPEARAPRPVMVVFGIEGEQQGWLAAAWIVNRPTRWWQRMLSVQVMLAPIATSHSPTDPDG